jgi:hypothetical protein
MTRVSRLAICRAVLWAAGLLAMMAQLILLVAPVGDASGDRPEGALVEAAGSHGHVLYRAHDDEACPTCAAHHQVAVVPPQAAILGAADAGRSAVRQSTFVPPAALTRPAVLSRAPPLPT